MQPLIVPKRTPKRSRVFLKAELDSGAGPAPVHLRDISRSGALLEAESVPKLGAEVRLACGNNIVDGRVAWAKDNCFGVKFATPLLAGDLMDATGARLKVSAPRTYRSGDLLD
ncbi:MAG: PilZ domain-containing protein [Sphingomicrobium sp.]